MSSKYRYQEGHIYIRLLCESTGFHTGECFCVPVDIPAYEANKLTGSGEATFIDYSEWRQYRIEHEKQEPKKKEDTPALQKSWVEVNGVLYEQVAGYKYVTLENGETKYLLHIQSGEVRFIPCAGDELVKHIVLLPEYPLPYGNIPSLVAEIKSFIHRWLDISPEFETFCAWYILLTWVYDRFDTLNYLRAMGDTGTGKSRFLDVVGRICYKPIAGSGAVSIAAVKRMVEKWRGTLLIDEGDFKISDETAELIKFLNLGFEAGKGIFNCNKEDPNKIEFFDPYGPKVITSRRQFLDQALEARCLTEVMKQTSRKEIPRLKNDEFHAQQAELRNKLLYFRLENYSKIDVKAAAMVDLGDVEPRIEQATRAFTALFANMPDVLEQFRSFVKNYNDSVIEERGASFDGLIVNVIVTLLMEGQEHISSQDIVNLLPEMKGANTRSIGRHLTQLGLKAQPIKVEGKTKKCIPLTKNLGEVVKRYISDKDKIGYVVTKVTSVMSSCDFTTTTIVTSVTSEKQEKLRNEAVLLPIVTNVPMVTEKLISKFPDLYLFVKAHKPAKYEEITEACSPEAKTLLDSWLADLRKKGDIFEPRAGYYEVIE